MENIIKKHILFSFFEISKISGPLLLFSLSKYSAHSKSYIFFLICLIFSSSSFLSVLIQQKQCQQSLKQSQQQHPHLHQQQSKQQNLL